MAVRRRMTDAAVGDRVVVVTEDGGSLPEIVDVGIGDSAMMDVGVLLMVRAAQWDGDASFVKAAAVLTALHGLRNVTVGGSGTPMYYRVRARTGEPVFAGYDEKGRPLHTVGVMLLRAVDE
jgi:hypothetical protein